MKILVVCQHFYPEEFLINDICFTLSKKNFDITVLTGKPNYPKGKIYKGYKCLNKHSEMLNEVKIKRTLIIPRGNNNVTIAINYVSFAINSSIKALFMKKDFDLVLAYQLSPISMVWPGIIVSKLKKIPLIIYVQDQWPASMLLGGIKEGTLSYKFFYSMSYNTYKHASLFLLSSRGFRQYFEKVLKITNKPFEYLPNYSENLFSNITTIKNDTFDILFAGNIGPAQNVESILYLAKELENDKEILIHIVGDGLSKSKCEELSKDLKLNNVKFYKRVSKEEVVKYYELADAFLITLEDNEVINRTIPTKIQTYMNASKPIFGMMNGEVNNIVNSNKCGYISKSGDYKDLSKIIRKTYKDSKLLKQYSMNCKKYYEDNFDKDKNINKLISIIEKKL